MIRRATFVTAASLLLLAAGICAAPAQSPSVAAGTAPVIQAPQAAPAVSGVQSGPPITIEQVVARVLAANPTVEQARIRAQRAYAVVPEATGQERPQIRVSASDTYSSIATYGTSVASTAPVSPTASIPIITDSTLNTLTTTGSTGLTSSGSTLTTSTGSGSTTLTTSTTPTIIPVQPAPSAPSAASTSQDRLRAVGRPEQTTGGATATQSTTPVSNSPRHNNYSASGSVTQVVDLFGLFRANNDATRKTAQFYSLDQTRVENDTALNAKDTYYAVLRAQSDVATAQEQLRNAQAVLDNAQIKFSAGAGAQFDVISAQTQVSSAEQNLINARNSLNIQRANLNNLMAQPLGTPLNLVAPPVISVPADTPVDREISAAYQGRPEVRQSTLTQQIAGDETRLARAGLLPLVGITGGVSYQPYLQTPGQPHATETLTATISVPLYDGGQTDARVKAARYDEATERSVADQLRLNIGLEVQSALVNVIDAQALVQSNQSAVAQNREAVRLANIRYTAGVGTLLEVTNAEANLVAAESNLNSAIFQQQSAYAALQRAEGKR